MPIYLLEITVGEQVEQRLIEAKTEAQALHHATRLHIKATTVRTAEQIKAMAELAAKGVKIEFAESD